MKEITRIHLAKVAYDIELDAKKEIQKYITALERYADDPELLDDIEIRMTELLAERGVPNGGVITTGDVAAVRAQLGEPSDFAPEGEPVVAESPSRQMYRDTEEAMLGGVAAGLAHFVGVRTMWVRLAFVILLMASFGTLLIVYAVLWLVVPPARTATERLQMYGKPVTLASIKKLGEQAEPVVSNAARVTQAILRYGAGLALIVMAAVALLATIVITFGAPFNLYDGSLIDQVRQMDSWWLMTALGLYVVSGILLTILCFILASAVFSRKWSRRIGVAVITIIVAGMVSFGSAVVLSYGGAREGMQKLQDAMQETKVNLPADFAGVKKLVVTAHTVGSPFTGQTNELAVEYIVDTHHAPRYELTALPGINPDITIDGDEARIAFKTNAAHNQFQGWVQPRLIIRGPALDELRVNQGIARYSAAYPDGQQQLRVWTGGTTHASISGQYQTVRIEGDGDTDISSSSVADLVVDMTGGPVTAGVVKTLSVTQPDACSTWGSYDSRMRVQVRAVSSEVIQYNGVEKAVGTSLSNGCGVVIVENRNAEFEEYEL